MRDEDLSWTVVERTPANDYGIFKTQKVRARHPQNGTEHDFAAIECADWVNVIALTSDDRVVTVRQFRHASETLCVEVPGGLVDPGELPGAAAARELLEETGYTAPTWRHLGSVQPNPAILRNRLHTYLALDAIRTTAPTPESGEVLDVQVIPLDEITDMLQDGRIDHALVMVAFAHLALAGGGKLVRPDSPRRRHGHETVPST